MIAIQVVDRGTRILGDELSPFARFACRIERGLRATSSEFWHLQLHDKLYRRLRWHIDPLRLRMGAHPARQRAREAIQKVRRLLDEGAKERSLQEVLVDSRLPALGCRLRSEVGMTATQDGRAMRMDLVVDPLRNDEPIQIIELKRGTHRLLAYCGTSRQRRSRALASAVSQVASYGDRFALDEAATVDVAHRHRIWIELRLIAGRRLPDQEAYDLLHQFAGANSTPRVLIYTWDGYLAELERIVG